MSLNNSRLSLGFPGGSNSKESVHNSGDLGSIPGLGRSPGEGNGYSLQYSFLENSMDRGASWATVQGVAKSWTQLRLTFSLSVVLGKSVHLLDCKQIQPIHSEGDQPWDFFGRNDAKAETPVLWPPHVKS